METYVTPCKSCVKHQNKVSLDDVSADCFPCIWDHKKTGVWTFYEPVDGTQMKELELAPMDTQETPMDPVNHPRHYNKAVEPIEYIMKNNLDFAEGSAVKYITRHKEKNGSEDIRKAIKFCEFILRYHYSETV